MAYICSKDPSHLSDDSDYCSICGAKIAGAPSVLSASAPPSLPSLTALGNVAPPAAGGANDSICPDCNTRRTPGARFCEVCRYDFERKAPSPTSPPPPLAAQPVAAFVAPPPLDVPAATIVAGVSAPPATITVEGTGGPTVAGSVPSTAPELSAVPASPVPTTALSSPTPPTPVPLPGGALRWEAVTVVDPTLYTDPDPDIPLPPNEPERTFPLDFAENLLGRRSDKKDIHPEIPVGDPGVSHRHAKLLRQPDGSFMLLDVGSTNGTRLNGVDVQPGVRTPLRDGDEITVGCWTRITIRAGA